MTTLPVLPAPVDRVRGCCLPLAPFTVRGALDANVDTRRSSQSGDVTAELRELERLYPGFPSAFR